MPAESFPRWQRDERKKLPGRRRSQILSLFLSLFSPLLEDFREGTLNERKEGERKRQVEGDPERGSFVLEMPAS